MKENFIVASVLSILFLICSYPACSVENKIVILSDCLSAAYGFDTKHSWVTLLETRLKKHRLPYTVVNLSNGGDTTQQGIEKIPDVLNHHPALVILALGGNDGLRGLSPAFIEKNLAHIIASIQKRGHKILLVRLLPLPSNYGPAYCKRFAAIFEQLRQQYHIKLVTIKTLESGAKKQDDNVHLSIDAQQDILEALWPDIVASLTPNR